MLLASNNSTSLAAVSSRVVATKRSGTIWTSPLWSRFVMALMRALSAPTV
jgi:hypothetical protein